jgi:hypothetical protein
VIERAVGTDTVGCPHHRSAPGTPSAVPEQSLQHPRVSALESDYPIFSAGAAHLRDRTRGGRVGAALTRLPRYGRRCDEAAAWPPSWPQIEFSSVFLAGVRASPIRKGQGVAGDQEGDGGGSVKPVSLPELPDEQGSSAGHMPALPGVIDHPL